MPASYQAGTDRSTQHPGKIAWTESPLLVPDSHSGSLCTALSFRSLFYPHLMLKTVMCPALF